MASSVKSKAEKKSNNGESSNTASKASKPRKGELKKKKNSNNKNKLSNGNVKDNSVLIIPSSSIESLEEAEKGHEIDNNGITNGRTDGTKLKKGKRKHEVGEKEDAKTNTLPIKRIRTIMRAEDPDLRVSEEAILVISKATVKFLEQFAREAYACSVQDRKKFLGYQRLSHVVGKQRRYDFLSDFVPEKLKAEDALRERNLGRDGEGQNM